MNQKEVLGDGDLIQQYLNGNEAAFEMLMKRHKNRVFTTIFFMVNDRYLAEDIFQESFIKAIRSFNPIGRPELTLSLIDFGFSSAVMFCFLSKTGVSL